MSSVSLSRALPISASRLRGSTVTRVSGWRAPPAVPKSSQAHRPLHMSIRNHAGEHQDPSSSTSSSSSEPKSDTTPQRRFVPPPTPGGKSEPGASRRGPRVGTLFLGLIVIGVGATMLGLVDFFGSFKTWPKELRDDLRTAIKARNRGESRRAEAHFRRALATARSLEPSKLEPGRLLKISGISIALGSLLESENEYQAAYQVYAEALDEVLGQGAFESSQQAVEPALGDGDVKGKKPAAAISPQERLRAVSLAQKLGDLASSGFFEGNVPPPSPPSADNASTLSAMGITQQNSAEGSSSMTLDDIAEKHYVWSVEELLRLVMSENQRQQALEADQRGEQGGVVIADLELPAEWGLTQSELGASMEALGGFYARKGKAELAVPLYLQALSILMPPPEKRGKGGKQPTASERCRAGILMNNLSQLLVNGVPGSKGGIQAAASGLIPTKEEGGTIGQARNWAEKGLEIVQSTQRMAGWDGSENGPTKQIVETSDERKEQVRLECAGAETTLLFNLGVLHEMSKDVCKAREYYQRAYSRADEAGFRDARNRSAQALAKLERIKA